LSLAVFKSTIVQTAKPVRTCNFQMLGWIFVSAHRLPFLERLSRMSVTDGGSCYCPFDEGLMTIKALKEQTI
jgi:hypothetical protein